MHSQVIQKRNLWQNPDANAFAMKKPSGQMNEIKKKIYLFNKNNRLHMTT